MAGAPARRSTATTCATCPVLAASTSYLEQRFGPGPSPAGWPPSAMALADRLATAGRHGADRHRGDRPRRARRPGRGGPDRGGEVDADHVVVAVDPRRLPALASYVERTMPAIPPVVCHLGLEGEVPDLPPEVVLHGDPMLVRAHRRPGARRCGGVDGAGPRPARGGHPGGAGAQRPRRPQHRSSPGSTARRATWSSAGAARRTGVQWQGPRTARARLGPRTPIAGVLRRRGARHPRVGPAVRRAQSAALVAQRWSAGPASVRRSSSPVAVTWRLTERLARLEATSADARPAPSAASVTGPGRRRPRRSSARAPSPAPAIRASWAGPLARVVYAGLTRARAPAPWSSATPATPVDPQRGRRLAREAPSSGPRGRRSGRRSRRACRAS